MTRLMEFAVLPWCFCSLLGWCMFALPQLAWDAA